MSIFREEMVRPRSRVINITQDSFARITAELSIPTQEILRVLPGIQEHELAWDLAVYLLNSESVNAQFYGAHTLHIQICKNWVQFKEDVERRQQIRDFILSRLFVSLSSQDNRSLVTIKLFAALIVLAFQEYQNGWTTFIEDILSAIDSAFPTQIERTELAKLQFLTLLSEEFETPRLGSINRANLAQYVGVEGRNVALRFIDRYTSIYDGQTSPDSDILREKGLNCLRNWVQFGIPSL
ncbi:hypothetical protein DSO57_1017893 [Entomophthora muscae]|uniref:Uncharacterized protein n=1 Tax=Entomophthora muscae TaxID=34485 RepID=A0ACC2URH5_9FUNG|nr:hypothetical protein DSO57_1017893 [Entomophthora muscae]